MAYYLTSAQYPDVRAALDITLDESRLPDGVIASAPYHPAAEAEVARRLGTLAAAAAGPPVAEEAQRAVVLLTAARLVPALPNVTRRQVGEVGLMFAPMDLTKRVAELRQAAAVELAALVLVLDPTATAAAQRPAVFGIAPGGRADRGGLRAEGTEVAGLGGFAGAGVLP